MFFEPPDFDSISILFDLLSSVSADGSLNLFLALNLGVPSSDLELINIQYSINQYSKFMALIPLAYYTVSSSDFEKIIFVYFVCNFGLDI